MDTPPEDRIERLKKEQFVGHVSSYVQDFLLFVFNS